MIINIQAPEIDRLIQDLFDYVPTDQKEQFRNRVLFVRSMFTHPGSDSDDVVLTYSPDRTFQATLPFGKIVPPMEWPKVTRSV